MLDIRGIRYHVREWLCGDDSMRSPLRTVVMLHGWMDVSASFQFVVDELDGRWRVLAPDWRGFGLSSRGGGESYWFPDYLADLDALLDQLVPGTAVDLLGHSMGGNIAMHYAGVRSQRVSRLMNLEGFGLASTEPSGAPARMEQWLDQLRKPAALRRYDGLEAVADRLRQNNPRLQPARARFLASHWSRACPDGFHALLADPAHRRINPMLYRADEAAAVWGRIRAQVMLVAGEQTDRDARVLADPGYRARLGGLRSLELRTIGDAGHMLHHDQPERVAALMGEFFGDRPGVDR